MNLKKGFQNSKNILLDLLLVVLGVLIAFSLNNFQTKKHEGKERAQIREQLKIELEKNLAEFFEAQTMYDSILNTFLRAERNMERPLIEFRNISMNYDLTTWNIAIEKGLFEPEMIYQISKMNSSISILRKYTDRLHDFNTSILIPNIDQPITEFYDSKTRRLKKKYSWYLDSLRKILFGFQEMNQHTRVLHSLINKS